MSHYQYGEEIKYRFQLLEESDKDKLQKFNCGNEKLDSVIHNEIELCAEDGLIFKAEDENTHDILAIVSLAASGIIFKQTNYMKILPAVKIDILAVDEQYQKLHYSQESEESINPDDHFYFSDCFMADIIRYCCDISENHLLVDFILLYADIKAYRFYERNKFLKFEEFMEQENNMEINDNIPMYMKLN